MEKKCYKCGQVKNLSLFYKHKQMSDGHFNKCIECAKNDATAHRNANIDRIRQYDKDRAKLPHRKLQASKQEKKFRREHPLASAAHCMVSRAVKAGILKRPCRCSVCHKKRKILAHHEDYKKPLDVLWLCQPCHKQMHKDEKC